MPEELNDKIHQYFVKRCLRIDHLPASLSLVAKPDSCF